MTTAKETKLKALGATKVPVKGCRDAWSLNGKLIWFIPGQSKVLVGYAHAPHIQGTMMSFKAAIS
jgi:hypothetical protein